jgi:hypothetical protein
VKFFNLTRKEKEMAIKAKEKSGVGIRLILAAAACAVLFVASPTTPAKKGLCGASAYGTIAIENASVWAAAVKFSGQSSIQTTVDGESSGAVTVEAGSYNWTATTTFSAGVHFAVSGSVNVEKDKTTGIVINFKE